MSLVRFKKAGYLPLDGEWAVVATEGARFVVQKQHPLHDTRDLVFHGTFSYGSRTKLSGSVTSLTYYVGGVEVATVSDFKIGASALQPFIDYGGALHISLFAGHDRLIGTHGTQHLWGFTGADYLDGGAGVDIMHGGAGNDIYKVDNANDAIREADPWDVGDLGGTDKVIATVNYQIPLDVEVMVLAGTARVATGKSGNETLQGNALANVLEGREGDDTLRGGGGDDVMDGSFGADLMFGGAGNDTLKGGSSDDTLTGGAGNDVLRGARGNDVIVGGTGKDTADDILDGGLGNDVLRGGGGNDVIVGSIGQDIMTGNAGNDRFGFNAVRDSGVTSSTRDVIVDFTRGQDRIDLSIIDAKPATTGTNDVFNFIGTSAFTAAGQVRIVVDAVNSKVTVQVNTDADASAELTIRLNGLSALAASDFVL